ncbi:response regulator [Aquimarina sp. 2201CG1-2-11]|uniref:response regulator n=1 Tax=Aquimarina discodermiae TaxID=3231043 RepID=UPI00346189F1
MMYYILGGALLILSVMLSLLYISNKRKLREKEIALKSLNKKTEEQLELQQELISILSQELRIPMYGIMGLTNILSEEHPNLKDDKNLKSLKFSGNYLLTLINNVLHVNFLDSKEVTVQNVLFDPRELTRNIINSFNYATENNNTQLSFDFDDEIDSMLYGDPAVLSQILMNLLSNALRFTKNGSVNFSVNLIKKKKGVSKVSFKVNHDGHEVSLEEQNSIYQEFINTRSTNKSHLGIGINSKISHRLAKILNGELIIQDNSQKGSEYALVVNFNEPEVKENNDNQSLKGFEAFGKKISVLIVDDNKLNLLVADKMLSKENYNCTTIDNGFDAIDLVKENDYDIILMDINMPKLNGIGTTKRIRKFNTEVSIIALTAVDVTQLNRQIVQAGLNDYILKPYNKNLLLEIIDKHLSSSSVEQ